MNGWAAGWVLFVDTSNNSSNSLDGGDIPCRWRRRRCRIEGIMDSFPTVRNTGGRGGVDMGICSSKCPHCSPHAHQRHFLTTWRQKIIPSLQDERDAACARLLAFDSPRSDDGKENVVYPDAKSEEEVFGYSIISQESRGGSRQETPEAEEKRFTVAVGDMHKAFPLSRSFDSRNGEKVTFLASQPPAAELNLYIVTWNMNGKALERSVAELLDVDGERHDLYVIGLQEAHNSVDESVISETLGEKYGFVSAASLHSLQLFIIARKSLLPFLSRPMVDKISTGGLGGLAGRQKGAVAITFRFKEASLLFVACHLAPHESNVGERNAQYHRIAQSVFSRQVPVVGLAAGVFSSCPMRNGLIIDDSHIDGLIMNDRQVRSDSNFVEEADVVVWMGDLNYRVEMNRSTVTFFIEHKLEQHLWSNDQLTKALQNGHAFRGYQEGQLNFRPTYKYDVGTDDYDTSAKERVPSWTDRILYKVGDANKVEVDLRSYNSINSIKSSDHRPVKALMRLRLRNQEQLNVSNDY